MNEIINEKKKNDIEFSDLSTKQEDLENLEIEKEEISGKKENLFNYRTPKSRSKVGRVFKALFHKGEPLIVIGPHWPLFLCLCTTISLILFLFLYLASERMNYYVKIFGEVNYLVFMASYIYTALVNPGIPKKDLWIKNVSINNAFQSNKIQNYRICPTCQLIMNIDENTTHCDDCEICVEGYDHHCPWTSKCIGKGNIISFYVFVGSIFTLILYFFFAAISILATF